MDWMPWYNGLPKPSWTPAPATIGLTWQILYPIILVASVSCLYRRFVARSPRSWPCLSPSTSWRT